MQKDIRAAGIVLDKSEPAVSVPLFQSARPHRVFLYFPHPFPGEQTSCHVVEMDEGRRLKSACKYAVGFEGWSGRIDHPYAIFACLADHHGLRSSFVDDRR
jgi:hypothetical protein